jgi:hypothetical protein
VSDEVGHLELFPIADVLSSKQMPTLFHDLQSVTWEPSVLQVEHEPSVFFRLFWTAVEQLADQIEAAVRHVPCSPDVFSFKGRLLNAPPELRTRHRPRYVSVVELRTEAGWCYALEMERRARHEHFSVLMLSAIPSQELTIAHFQRVFRMLADNGGWLPMDRRDPEAAFVRAMHQIGRDPIGDLCSAMGRARDRVTSLAR